MKSFDIDTLDSVPPELRALIPGFLHRREREAEELFYLLEQEDWTAIREIGHRIKGTGTGYGFPLISEIGRDLEDAAKTEDTERAKLLIEKLEGLTKRIKGLIDDQ